MSEPDLPSPAVESLPARVPIFPLRDCVLLPRGNLPLNIFEPRYLQMTRDAMQTDQVIGMIQPREAEEGDGPPALFATGCVGRISSYNETEDGRIEIVLTGAHRFDVARELATTTPYRQVIADYGRWSDADEQDEPPEAMRDGLLGALEPYFEQRDIRADWKSVRQAPLSGLVISLSMICPFEASEKQALLEARTAARQLEILIALLRMDALDQGGDQRLH